MTPFQPSHIPPEEVDRLLQATAAEWNENPELYKQRWRLPLCFTLSDRLECIRRLASEDEMWLNDTYQVAKRPLRPVEDSEWPPMVHLSIKRIDRQPIHDWRDLQAIKSQLVGHDCEGVELYPAEARVVDTANQYHLWVITTPGIRFPFGFETGVRLEHSTANSCQRPFSR